MVKSRSSTIHFVWGLALAALLGPPRTGLAQSADVRTYVLFADTSVDLGVDGTVVDGHVGSNGMVIIRSGHTLSAPATLAADLIRVRPHASVLADTFFNQLHFSTSNSIAGMTHSPLILPVLTLPAPAAVAPGTNDVTVAKNATATVPAGAYGVLRVEAGGTLVLAGGGYDVDTLVTSPSPGAPTTVLCTGQAGCTVRVRARLTLKAEAVGTTGSDLAFQFSGTHPVVVGYPGAQVRATVEAPLALVRLKSARRAPSSFIGQFVGMRIRVGSGATVSRGPIITSVCGNGALEPPAEECDPPQDTACPGTCLPDCQCAPPPGTAPTLVAIGPSVLNNATSFGVQIFGDNFVPGAQLQLSDRSTNVVIETLPATWISSTELTALVPAGMDVPAGIQSSASCGRA